MRFTMARNQGGVTTTDRITIANNATFNQSFDVVTFLFCGRLSVITSGRAMVQKGSNGAASKRDFIMSGSTGNLQCDVSRATTALQYITNDTPMAVTGRVYYAACTIDINANPAAHIYVGTDTKPLTESTYGTTTNGSGATNSDAASSLFIGNNFANAAPWAGTIWAAGYIPGIIPFTELIQWQNNIFLGRQLAKRGGYWFPGFAGTGVVYDESGNGNHGTQTLGGPVPDALPRGLLMGAA